MLSKIRVWYFSFSLIESTLIFNFLNNSRLNPGRYLDLLTQVPNAYLIGEKPVNNVCLK